MQIQSEIEQKIENANNKKQQKALVCAKKESSQSLNKVSSFLHLSPLIQRHSSIKKYEKLSIKEQIR